MASAASLWELCHKAGRKDALVAEPVEWWNKYVAKLGIPILNIRTADVIAQSSLPAIHKDPFGRILVAQALVEGAALVTRDQRLAKYGVPTIW
jgi:PIN domain nuclease of toxin-antitoxin system